MKENLENKNKGKYQKITEELGSLGVLINTLRKEIESKEKEIELKKEELENYRKQRQSLLDERGSLGLDLTPEDRSF